MAPPTKGKDSGNTSQMKQKTLFGFMKKKDDGEASPASTSSPAAPKIAAAATSVSTPVAPSTKAKATPFKPLVQTVATPVQAPREVKASSAASNPSSASSGRSAHRSPASSSAEPIDVDMLDDDAAVRPKLVCYLSTLSHITITLAYFAAAEPIEAQV